MNADEPVVTPSDVAVRRLQGGLQRHLGTYQDGLDTDLDDIDRAVAAGREDLALEVVQAHLARLEALSDELRAVVAEGAVEAEAEAVLARAARAVEEEWETPRRSLTAGSHGTAGLRRGAMAVACVVLVAAVTVTGRPLAPADPQLAASTASDEALVAARDVTAASSVVGVAGAAGPAEVADRSIKLRSAISAIDPEVLRDPAVRERLEMMLAALPGLHLPDSASLLPASDPPAPGPTERPTAGPPQPSPPVNEPVDTPPGGGDGPAGPAAAPPAADTPAPDEPGDDLSVPPIPGPDTPVPGPPDEGPGGDEDEDDPADPSERTRPSLEDLLPGESERRGVGSLPLLGG